MLIVLPVHAKDLTLAVRNLEWAIQMDGRSSFPCLVSYERGLNVSALVDQAVKYFSEVRELEYDPWSGAPDWPQPQNYAWQSAARYIEQKATKDEKWRAPWFWWEADAIPMRPGFLTILDDAHNSGGRTVSGHVCTHAGFTYIAGVAIYPWNVSTYFQTAMLVSSQPWDIMAGMRDGVVRRAHDITPLILHTPDKQNTHFSSMSQVTAQIPDTAVIFHKCKDGSLLDVLQGRSPVEDLVSVGSESPMAHPSFTEQTSWPSGYFTFPTATNTCYFNCGLAEHMEKLWLFTRRFRYNRAQVMGGASDGSTCDLAIWELRDNMTVRPNPIIPALPLRNQHEQWEDPRAIVVDDRVHVAFANWVHYKQWYIRQSFVKLTPDWRRGEVLFEPAYGGNARKPELAKSHEKNWIWFRTASGDSPPSWHCIYTINPHVVFRVSSDGTVLQEWKSRELELPWQFGEPRGGTPPIKVGDEYLCFFHSALTWQKPRRRYFMGAYAFSATPPFEVLRMTTEPLLVGSEDDFRALGGPLVIFPNGAVLKDDTWTVVFGVNDENCGWIKIPNMELQERLIQIGRKRGVVGRLIDAVQNA